jgi:hypothetical protein
MNVSPGPVSPSPSTPSSGSPPPDEAASRAAATVDVAQPFPERTTGWSGYTNQPTSHNARDTAGSKRRAHVSGFQISSHGNTKSRRRDDHHNSGRGGGDRGGGGFERKNAKEELIDHELMDSIKNGGTRLVVCVDRVRLMSFCFCDQ